MTLNGEFFGILPNRTLLTSMPPGRLLSFSSSRWNDRNLLLSSLSIILSSSSSGDGILGGSLAPGRILLAPGRTPGRAAPGWTAPGLAPGIRRGPGGVGVLGMLSSSLSALTWLWKGFPRGRLKYSVNLQKKNSVLTLLQLGEQR